MTALTFRKNSLIGPCIWVSITRYKPSWLQSDFFLNACLVTLHCEHLMGETSVSIICGFNCTLGSKWCPCRHVQLNPGTVSLCSGEITVFKQVSWELPQSSIGQTNRNSHHWLSLYAALDWPERSNKLSNVLKAPQNHITYTLQEISLPMARL